MKRRLFIAINLSEGVKKKLIDYQKKCLSAEALAKAEDKIRWVKKESLHITLLFIGYVTDDEMHEIINSVKETAKKHNPFLINLERIILGPASSAGRPQKTPRMFWIQGEKSKEIGELQGDLEEKIQQRSGGRHAFRPHITLSRFKHELLKSLPKEVNDEFKAQVPVETIEIMQSNLRRSGAEYSVLESIELGE